MITQIRNKVESREKRVERKTFKPKPLILIICLTTLMLANSRAWGQEVGLVVNELKVFPVSKLERVAIGDPAVADITVLSQREVMLIAKGAGTTSLIIWDESGQRSFNITVIAKDLEKIAQRIRGLFDSSDIQGLMVKVEEDNVYIIGEVLTEYELKKIEDTLVPFTNVINLVKIKERQPLVEIDVNVLEINCEDMKTLGMVWSSSVLYTEPSGAQAGGGAKDIKRQTTGKFPKLWRVFKWDRSTIDAKLNFLIQENKVRTLANPKLVTVSGKEASFLVGGEVPYIIVETEGRTSVQWKEYGINLKILPLVNVRNEIKISLEAEVSDLGTSITHQGYSIPSITTRKAQTELFLNEGDTIFLAGLIKNYDSRGIERLPWLSKVPILGELFKSTQFQDKRTELVISLSPKIIGERAYTEDVAPKMGKQGAVREALGGFPEYEEESPITYYSQMIEDIITRSVVYPAKAKEAKIEGIVKIDLHLLSNGQLKEAKVREPSGYSDLDQAALTAVQDVALYPSFPSQITQKELRLSVPVVFKSYVEVEDE